MRKRTLWGASFEDATKPDGGKCTLPKPASSSENRTRVGGGTFATSVCRRVMGTGPGGRELGARVSRVIGGIGFNFGSVER